MKNKVKLLALVLAGICMLAACGKEPSLKEAPDRDVEERGDEAEAIEKGEIIKDAEPVSSNIVVINDVEYNLPMKVSELMDNGWKDNEFKFNDKMAPGAVFTRDYYLYSDDGGRISIEKIYNSADSSKSLKECYVTGLAVEKYGEEIAFPESFVFPGGITNNSVRENIIAVYGDPNNPEIFGPDSGESFWAQLIGSDPEFGDAEKRFYYDDNVDSGSNFSFYITEDGEICGAEIHLMVIPDEIAR